MSQTGMLIVIALLGTPPLAVLAAALAALTQDLFTHANISVPSRVDRCLRWIIITPDLHRTHHSNLIVEQNKNFGTILSVWDRLFGTYRGEFGNLSYGLKEYETGSLLSPGRLLAMPFRDPTQTSNVSVEIAAHPTVTTSTQVS